MCTSSYVQSNTVQFPDAYRYMGTSFFSRLQLFLLIFLGEAEGDRVYTVTFVR